MGARAHGIQTTRRPVATNLFIKQKNRHRLWASWSNSFSVSWSIKNNQKLYLSIVLTLNWVSLPVTLFHNSLLNLVPLSSIVHSPVDTDNPFFVSMLQVPLHAVRPKLNWNQNTIHGYLSSTGRLIKHSETMQIRSSVDNRLQWSHSWFQWKSYSQGNWFCKIEEGYLN